MVIEPVAWRVLSTPRLTTHAKQRCVEMDVTTKRVKRLIRHVDCDYPGYRGTVAHIAFSDVEPDLAVVYVIAEDGVPVVLTVLWRGVEFVRPSTTPLLHHGQEGRRRPG